MLTARQARRKLGSRKTRKQTRTARTKLKHVFARARKRGSK